MQGRSQIIPHGRLSGFTLIELLVVIAIIAILAAILFPVFATARDNANIGKCQAHQKQLVAALMMYVDDYNGWLPRKQFLSTGYGGLFCDPYVKNKEILTCTAKFRDPDVGYVDPNGPDTRHRPMGFAYNQHCLCDTFMTKSNVPGTDVNVVYRNWDQWKGRPLSDIKTPSRTPGFFCAESVHSIYYGNKIVWLGFGWEPEDSRRAGRMVNAHKGGSNYAFLDGHVKYFKPPVKNGFYQAIKGLDYDGNGTYGDDTTMR